MLGRIPGDDSHELLDPLTIGAADDDSKVYREALEIDVPQADLLAAIYPRGAAHLPDGPLPLRPRSSSRSGPRFSELIAGGKSVAIVMTTSSGPTPQSRLLPAIFDALEAAGTTDAAVICANGKVFPMSDADTEMKIGRENLARMERMGSRSSRTTRAIPSAYSYVGVSSRGTPVWLHNEVAKRDVKITIGQSQANHWARAAAES